MYSVRHVSSPYSYLAISSDEADEDAEVEVDEDKDASPAGLVEDMKSRRLFPFDAEAVVFFFIVLPIALKRNFIIVLDACDISSCFGCRFYNL